MAGADIAADAGAVLDDDGLAQPALSRSPTVRASRSLVAPGV